MTTALAQQLQQLAVAAGTHVGKHKPVGKASLLWEAREAADIDIETVYDVAIQGFEELVSLDGRFAPFRSSLFARSSLRLSLEQLTAGEQSGLEASLSAFCRLLCAHWLRPAALKACEYLLRRWRAHETSVGALMSAALPYHATPQFARLVQVLRLEGSLFAFLTPAQASGAPLPRAALAARAAADPGLLAWVAEAASEAGRPEVACPRFPALYAALACDVLALEAASARAGAARPRAAQERLAQRLVPHLVAGLRPEAGADYRAATLMVGACLAAKAPLAPSAGAALAHDALVGCCGRENEDGGEDGSPLPGGSIFPRHEASGALKLLAVLAARRALLSLDAPSLTLLTRCPGAAEQLAALAGRGAAGQALAALVCEAALREGCSLAAPLAEALLRKAPLEPATARRVALAALAAASEGEAAAEPTRSLLRVLGLVHGEALDAACERAFRRAGQAGDEAGAARMLLALEAALEGSSRAPLPGSDAAAPTSLRAGADAPAAATREAALRALASGLRGDPRSELAAFALEAGLRRAADEEVEPALAALRLLREGARRWGAAWGGSREALLGAAESALERGLACLAPRGRRRGQAPQGRRGQGRRLAAAALQLARALEAPERLEAMVLAATPTALVASSKLRGAVGEAAAELGERVWSAAAHAALAESQEEAGEAALAAALEVFARRWTDCEAGAARACELLASASPSAARLRSLVLGALAAEGAEKKASRRRTASEEGVDFHSRVVNAVVETWNGQAEPAAESPLSLSLAVLVCSPGLEALALEAALPRCAWACLRSFEVFAALSRSPLPSRRDLMSALLALAGAEELAAFADRLADAAAAAEEAPLALAALERWAAWLRPAKARKEGRGSRQAVEAAWAPSRGELLQASPRLAAALLREQADVRAAAAGLWHAVAAEGAGEGAGSSQAGLSALARAVEAAEAEVCADADAALGALCRACRGRGSEKDGRSADSAQGRPTPRDWALDRLSASALCSRAALAGAELCLDMALAGGSDPALAEAALGLLRKALASPFSPEVGTLAGKAVERVFPALGDAEAAAQAVLALLESEARARAADALQAAVIPALTPALFAALSPAEQRRALAALLALPGAGPLAREAAGAALSALEPSGEALAGLLWESLGQSGPSPTLARAAAPGPPTPSPAKRRASLGRAREGEEAGPTAESAAAARPLVSDLSPDRVAAAVPVLEFVLGLPAAPSRALDAVLDPLGAALLCFFPGAAPPEAPLSPLAAYACGLVLQTAAVALAACAAPGAALARFPGAALVAAAGLPAPGLRDPALQTLAVAAQVAPEAALELALGAARAAAAGVQASAAEALLPERAGGAARAARSLLSALAPAWAARGEAPEALVDAVLEGGLAGAARGGLLETLAADLEGGVGLVAERVLDRYAGREGRDVAVGLLAEADETSCAEALASLLQRACARGPSTQLDWATVLGSLGSEVAAARRGRAQLPPGVWEPVLASALALLDALGQENGAEEESDGSEARRLSSSQPSDLRARESLQALLSALRLRTPHAAYVQALAQRVALRGARDDRAARRALALLERAAEDAGLAGGLGAGEDAVAWAAAADAARAVVERRCGAGEAEQPAPKKRSKDRKKSDDARDEPASPSTLTTQHALALLAVASPLLGPARPDSLSRALPAALRATGSAERSWAVRASAAAALARLARSLGGRALPRVPEAVRALSSALAEAAGPEGGAPESVQTVVACLAALEALAETVGAFLAPSLPSLLGLLLGARVLGCRALGCGQRARALSDRLVAAAPPRLALPAVLGALAGAGAVDPGAAAALLRALPGVLERLGAGEAGARAEEAWVALLGVLEGVRAEQGRWTAAEEDAVEAAALDALVGLALRLSDARFRPLVARAVGWARRAVGHRESAARGMALCALASALAQALRSLFSAHWHLGLLDAVLECLEAGGVEVGERTKKAKKASLALDVQPDADPSSLPAMRWRCRLRALHALHRALLFDAGAPRFWDPEVGARLRGPLARALGAHPPGADMAEALAREAARGPAGLGGDLGWEAGPVEPAARGRKKPRPDADDGRPPAPDAAEPSVVSLAAARALVQLAVTGAADSEWRAAQQALLQATRERGPATRAAALEGLAGLAAALGDEYLPMLPEALPCLAELLEDGRVQVEGRAQRLLARLETLSGEDLKQYLHA